VKAERDVVGAVLAGGRATRMGGAKAGAELRGRPLIEYPLAAMEEAGIAACVLAKRDTALPALPVPLWLEPDAPAHPFCGVVAAIEQAGGPVVVCGCDVPFVRAKLLRHLADSKAPLVVPRFGGRLHPLLARYGPELLEPLREALAAERPLQAVVAELGPQFIDEEELRRFGDPELLTFNVNTAEDLRRAEKLLG
jgi:molybdenum cofactor guanylyltransferase